ncbi:hypothetical protein A6A06_36000 [Streptomyces sp. CB02923]|uniref:hypothetical protein n=1 Tax=Streptomyces sp. CB02923 TaxID=1718985 RepID=UPI00093E7C9A|nr:hypothetical protein [Streptomyces sp. CB02923]OKI07319.1 hypothetical protein A6A06_36000 [Streptomyces sp. CB02923]
MKTIAKLAILGSVLALIGGGFLLFRVIHAAEPYKAERGDFVGSWAGPGGARLTVREDGTVTGEKVPNDYAGSAGAATATFSGSGTWTMVKRTTSLANQKIEVTLRTGPKQQATVEMGANGQGAKDGLYIPMSAETEERIVLKKAS